MRLFTTIAALQCYLNLHRANLSTTSVGLVPTMGALHQGHLSLIDRARQDNTLVVVSIFVNPLQFAPNEDFKEYPRQLDKDREICQKVGVDAIFAPSPEEIYGGFPESSISSYLVVPPPEMTSVLCGKYRPSHFQGVSTIVTKLLNIVQPTRVYFGQKDAQQVSILQRLINDLNMSVEMVVCPTVREPSGLAFSSRNQYLTPQQQEQALVLSHALRQGEKVLLQGDRAASAILAAAGAELIKVPGVQLQYLELVDPQTLMPLETVEESGLLAIAAYVGSTRLIDNIILRNRQPIVAIDGPAGAGKSTITKLVAKTLGLIYLDTGAMYRAVTWLVLNLGVSVEDQPAISELVSQCQIEFKLNGVTPRIEINNHDVTEAIRTSEVTGNVSTIAAQPEVRKFMVKQQRSFGKKGGMVAEGRDIGTNVFPDAELKIFLTASLQERARRRLKELQEMGETISAQQLEKEIALRDEKDSTRDIAPLRKAEDAIEILTDGLTIDQVLQKIVNLYQRVMGNG